MHKFSKEIRSDWAEFPFQSAPEDFFPLQKCTRIFWLTLSIWSSLVNVRRSLPRGKTRIIIITRDLSYCSVLVPSSQQHVFTCVCVRIYPGWEGLDRKKNQSWKVFYATLKNMVILCKRSKSIRSGGFSTVFWEREESKVYQTGSCRLTPRIWKKLGRAAPPPPPLDLWVRLKIHKVRYYQLWDKPILRLLANPRSLKNKIQSNRCKNLKN